jgi:hypothetical protein
MSLIIWSSLVMLALLIFVTRGIWRWVVVSIFISGFGTAFIFVNFYYVIFSNFVERICGSNEIKDECGFIPMVIFFIVVGCLLFLTTFFILRLFSKKSSRVLPKTYTVEKKIDSILVPIFSGIAVLYLGFWLMGIIGASSSGAGSLVIGFVLVPVFYGILILSLLATFVSYKIRKRKKRDVNIDINKIK